MIFVPFAVPYGRQLTQGRGTPKKAWTSLFVLGLKYSDVKRLGRVGCDSAPTYCMAKIVHLALLQPQGLINTRTPATTRAYRQYTAVRIADSLAKRGSSGTGRYGTPNGTKIVSQRSNVLGLAFGKFYIADSIAFQCLIACGTSMDITSL